MEISELRKKSDKELHKLLAQKRNELRELNFNIAAKQHKNFNALKDTKHDIARIMTVFKEKSLLVKTKSVEESKPKKVDKK